MFFLTWFMGSLTIFISKSSVSQNFHYIFPLYLKCVYLERLSQINVIFNASFSPFSFFLSGVRWILLSD